MSKRWHVYGIISASVCVTVEAETKEEAEDKAASELDCPTLCHQCAREIDLGDIYEFQVEEAL